MDEEKNEYVKAQELSITGLSLDEIDVKKAVRDKAKLPANAINNVVAAKIDAYLTTRLMVLDAAEEAVKVDRQVKKDKKKKEKE